MKELNNQKKHQKHQKKKLKLYNIEKESDNMKNYYQKKRINSLKE